MGWYQVCYDFAKIYKDAGCGTLRNGDGRQITATARVTGCEWDSFDGEKEKMFAKAWDTAMGNMAVPIEGGGHIDHAAQVFRISKFSRKIWWWTQEGIEIEFRIIVHDEYLDHAKYMMQWHIDEGNILDWLGSSGLDCASQVWLTDVDEIPAGTGSTFVIPLGGGESLG